MKALWSFKIYSKKQKLCTTLGSKSIRTCTKDNPAKKIYMFLLLSAFVPSWNCFLVFLFFIIILTRTFTSRYCYKSPKSIEKNLFMLHQCTKLLCRFHYIQSVKKCCFHQKKKSKDFAFSIEYMYMSNSKEKRKVRICTKQNLLRRLAYLIRKDQKG